MRKFWDNLPFFWKVYISAIALIITVVGVAEWSEDVIPYLTDYKRMNRQELERLLDEYVASGSSHAEWHDRMKEQGIWLLDLPLPALGGWVDGDPHDFSVLELLPESDDWTDDWIIVEKILPDGRLVAMGLDEPLYSDFLDALIWLCVIALFAGAACYYLSKFLTSRLSVISDAARLLTKGDLTARVPAQPDGGDELAALARLFNRMVESVERVVENERRLLYDISHELRSPLARMHLALGLASGQEPEKAEKYLDLMRGDIERMTAIMDALMEQGHPDSTLDDIVDEFDVGELLREITALADFQFGKSGKGVRCKLESSLPEPFMFRGGRSLLEQAVFNLLSNSLRYSANGGSVEISAALEDGAAGKELVIGVRDYGPGVPEESLADIFRPFFRVDGSRNQHSGGAGLGLALVSHYVKRLGGRVSAANAAPGLAVRIALPI